MVKDINNFYFTDEEYDIFAEKYQEDNSKYVRDIRKSTQETLLEINKEMLKLIANKKLELYNHSRKQNITSLIFPCAYNKNKVNWLGVRYGKHPKDIRDWGYTLDDARGFNPGYSSKYADNSETTIKQQFQKHACLQINVGYNGVDIGIFHAVPHGAVDRLHLHSLIDNNDVKIEQIKQELENLKYYGYEWNIWDTNLEYVEVPDFGGANDPEKVYKFDNENKEDFITWYSKNDKDGCYSSMLVHFPRYDERINKENLTATAIKIFEQLYPLYKLISLNIHYTGKVEL